MCVLLLVNPFSLAGLHLKGENKGKVCLVKRFLDDAHIIME